MVSRTTKIKFLRTRSSGLLLRLVLSVVLTPVVQLTTVVVALETTRDVSVVSRVCVVLPSGVLVLSELVPPLVLALGDGLVGQIGSPRPITPLQGLLRLGLAVLVTVEDTPPYVEAILAREVRGRTHVPGPRT